MVMASIMMDQMLLACQGFTHVKKVVVAVAVCLEQALAMLSSSGAVCEDKLNPFVVSASNIQSLHDNSSVPS